MCPLVLAELALWVHVHLRLTPMRVRIHAQSGCGHGCLLLCVPIPSAYVPCSPCYMLEPSSLCGELCVVSASFVATHRPRAALKTAQSAGKRRPSPARLSVASLAHEPSVLRIWSITQAE